MFRRDTRGRRNPGILGFCAPILRSAASNSAGGSTDSAESVTSIPCEPSVEVEVQDDRPQRGNAIGRLELVERHGVAYLATGITREIDVRPATCIHHRPGSAFRLSYQKMLPAGLDQRRSPARAMIVRSTTAPRNSGGLDGSRDRSRTVRPSDPRPQVAPSLSQTAS